MKSIFNLNCRRSLILVTIITFPLFGISQKEFKNQGEQEKYWEKEVFAKSFKYDIERFKGSIKYINKTTIKYDSTTLKILYTDSIIKQIFTLGIFYPDVFTKEIDSTIVRVSKSYNKNSSDEINIENSKSINDTITISNVEELTFLNPSYKVKRFKFLRYYKWIINPSVYFFELTNDIATDKTDLISFIRGAKLTFIKSGSLLI